MFQKKIINQILNLNFKTMKLFLTAALLFAANFCSAQSFYIQAVSNGEGNIGISDSFDVSTSFTEGKTVSLNVEARVTSTECWALAYYHSGGSAVWAEAPYNGYFDEDFDSIYVQPNSFVTFSASVVANAPAGEYAFSSAAANW